MKRMMTKDVRIGEALTIHPLAERIFKRFLCSHCLSCPRIRNYTIAFVARQLRIDPEVIVQDLNALPSPLHVQEAWLN